MATQIKPKSSGAFTTVTTDSSGRASDASTGMPAQAGLVHAALRAVNEWHNQPGNVTVTARAQKTAAAAGIIIQEV